MPFVRWHDRKTSKARLRSWIAGDDSLLVIQAHDSREISDIGQWLQEETTSSTSCVARVYYPSDIPLLKHRLMSDMVQQLVFAGLKGNLNQFYHLYENPPSKLPVHIYQNIGTGIQAKGDVEYESLHQQVVFPGGFITLEDRRESAAGELCRCFLNWLKEACTGLHMTVIMQFLGRGFSALSSDFRSWFVNVFCRALVSLGNMKIAIVNQGECEDLYSLSVSPVETIPEHLTLAEIEADTGNRSFCLGVVEPDSHTVNYTKFQRQCQLLASTEASPK